ncbi:MAG: BrxA/BrxB family bacilliredoxin [Chloroherpetonaceae bacterium]|nr:BrxA/BrxB family bacilliredoxin [Chloroherpetonaceae bacterium]MDW8437090.1 BrxA/BrxB family bacilliredoxin [Chloroherpetonaceae bacterium]
MFDIIQREAMIQQMRDELTRAGVKELRTPEEVDAHLPNAKGSTVVFVNSVCGCAAGKARPGFVMSLQNEVVPDNLFTVFAGQDKEATARARTYFGDAPPSSPSIAFFKDGKFLGIMHRHQIEARSAEMIANDLKNIYNKYFKKEAERSA